MAQDKQISKGEIFLSRFLKGSAKAIPVAGPLLEELLFNAGDEIEAKEQAARVQRKIRGDIRESRRSVRYAWRGPPDDIGAGAVHGGSDG